MVIDKGYLDFILFLIRNNVNLIRISYIKIRKKALLWNIVHHHTERISWLPQEIKWKQNIPTEQIQLRKIVETESSSIHLTHIKGNNKTTELRTILQRESQNL
jgi:uncharacterized UPF0160 family protein